MLFILFGLNGIMGKKKKNVTLLRENHGQIEFKTAHTRRNMIANTFHMTQG
jgi:hypothetical protein